MKRSAFNPEAAAPTGSSIHPRETSTGRRLTSFRCPPRALSCPLRPVDGHPDLRRIEGRLCQPLPVSKAAILGQS